MAATTPLKAVRARCLDCAAGDHTYAGVRDCTIEDCALYDLRSGHGSRAVLRLVRRHCTWCSGDRLREVAQCTATACALHAYRSGHRPKPQTSPLTPETRAREATPARGRSQRDTQTHDEEKEAAA